MGRFVDLDKPLSEEDKDYLRSRGRAYLIPANERRFGEDGKRKPEDHEKAGAPAQSPFYDTQERDRAVYDTGGAPLPDSTLDYNTGRAYDRENGVLVEPRPAGHTPGAFPVNSVHEVFGIGQDDGDSDIDDDVAEEVTSIKTVADLKKRLDKEGVQYDSEDKKADLQDRLAIHLQDKKDGKA
jgi:hypothetical protein